MVSIFLSAVFMIAPIIGYAIIPLDFNYLILGWNFTAWRLYLMVASTMNVATLFVVTWLPESPQFLVSISKIDEAVHAMKMVYMMNTGRMGDVSAIYIFV